VEYKTLGNWRQIYNVNNYDVCKLLSMPVQRCAYGTLNELFGGFILHRCPYLPGRLEIVNLTNFEVIELIIGSEPAVISPEDDWVEKFLENRFFKGDLRGSLTLKTKADPKGFKVIAIYSITEQRFDLF